MTLIHELSITKASYQRGVMANKWGQFAGHQPGFRDKSSVLVTFIRISNLPRTNFKAKLVHLLKIRLWRVG